MRILVFEYITGGGLRNESIPPALAEEGNLMIRALAADLLEIPGIDVTVMRDRRLGWSVDRGEKPVAIAWIERDHDLAHRLEDLMACCDAVWPIAPETGGTLEKLSDTVVQSQKMLLNSPPAAVRVTASKLATARVLAKAGVPVVPTYTMTDIPPGSDRQWVVKPDDGVGCEGAHILKTLSQLDRMLRAEQPTGAILQPYIAGEPVSISAIFFRGQALLLSCNRQRISVTGTRLRLVGSQVNGIDSGEKTYRNALAQVAAALPDLWGYAGIDLIATGEGLWVLEINPRLTTSYAGIRQATGINPAECVIDLIHNACLVNRERTANRSVEIDWG